MRTTVDLPEDLLRRVRATAALRGIKLKDFMASLLEKSLTTELEVERIRGQKRRTLPVMIPPAGRNIPVMTNAEIFNILDHEDDLVNGRLP